MNLNKVAASSPPVSIRLEPSDRRCRWWAKVVLSGAPLPNPSEILSGANEIPGDYLRGGTVDLLPGDLLFRGQENHHSKQRGWTHSLTYVDSAGQARQFGPAFGELKAAAKAQGLAAHLLAGSGPVAGAIRIAHALRAGLTF